MRGNARGVRVYPPPISSFISIGVAVGPGASPFTTIPCGIKVFAKPSVNPRKPHFDKVYGEFAGRKLDDEQMFRMFPRERFSFR